MSFKRFITTASSFETGDVFVKHTQMYTLMGLAFAAGWGLVGLNQWCTARQLEGMPSKEEMSSLMDLKLHAMEVHFDAKLHAMEVRSDVKLQAMETRLEMKLLDGVKVLLAGRRS